MDVYLKVVDRCDVRALCRAHADEETATGHPTRISQEWKFDAHLGLPGFKLDAHLRASGSVFVQLSRAFARF